MWLKELFGTDKPVIGMMHLMAMPTDPKYDSQAGLQKVIERARHDLKALQDGGIDGVLFTNEFSIPYVENVRPVTIACMARIIGELMDEIKVPFGVNVAMDPMKAMDLAAATGAKFVRGLFRGAYVGDSGITEFPMGEMARHRSQLHLNDVKFLCTVVPEGDISLRECPIEDSVKAFEFSFNPDAMLVFGPCSGQEIDDSLVVRAKTVTDKPVMASNGVRLDTIERTLSVCDGCIVGTWLKYNGSFYDAVDPERVKALMSAAKKYRGDR